MAFTLSTDPRDDTAAIKPGTPQLPPSSQHESLRAGNGVRDDADWVIGRQAKPPVLIVKVVLCAWQSSSAQRQRRQRCGFENLH
jgi:hypothetical protein